MSDEITEIKATAAPENGSANGGDCILEHPRDVRVEAGLGNTYGIDGDIIFSTGGVERLRITHDGKFRVGGGDEVEGAEDIRRAFLDWLASTGLFQR